MTQLTPEQRRTRARVESLIKVMSPVLDAVLLVGERISRIVEPVDHEYYPPRTGQVEPPPSHARVERASES
jgi:hypothetical protein